MLASNLGGGPSSETLTGRELGVLTLLARGKSNKEIGANLFSVTDENWQERCENLAQLIRPAFG